MRNFKNVFFIKKIAYARTKSTFWKRKKSEQKKGVLQGILVYRSRHHDFFLLWAFAGQLFVEGRHSVGLRRRIEFIQKVSAPHFSLGVLSTLLPSLLPSIHRCSGLVHASLITSGRLVDWRAEKATIEECKSRYINISYKRRAMCWSFINISVCLMRLFITSHFSKSRRTENARLAIVINPLKR